ncbi:MAG: hypothetical protein IJK81_08325 [Selenomonadaceae bacterium]|nr:hypothetical protein [Selenomonadaceae bacterium]
MIAEKINDRNALPVEVALGVGFLTGLAGDFTPHPERQRVITERKTIHD